MSRGYLTIAPMTNRPLAALADVTRTHPDARKWLVGPDLSWGRELLFALARRTGGWVGWESVTLKGIAADLAFVAMAEAGITNASDIELGAITDEALALAKGARKLTAPFARLAGGLGFRDAVRDAVLSLRTAGLSPDEVRARAPRASDIAAVLEQYERLLTEKRLADPARLFRLALEQFDAESAYTLAPVIALAPDLRTAGLPGALRKRLVECGARVLEGDPAHGLDSPWAQDAESWPGDAEDSILSCLNAPPTRPPCSLRGASAASDEAIPVHRNGALSTVEEAPLFAPGLLRRCAPRNEQVTSSPSTDIFRAATPSDEVREVLRRIAAEGLRYEDVELLATDRDTYGLALECLAAPLGIPVTSFHGIPLTRTRLGRAIERWLGWVEEGLPADVLRESLEAGELVAPDSGDDAMAPVRLLRELTIGWGRARWDQAHA